jgi:VCBS repeat-containing protein
LSQGRNWIMIGAIAIGILFLGSVEAHARSSYLSNSNNTGFTDVYPNTQGTRLDSCIVCHNQSSNGSRLNSRNPYGSAWEGAGGNRAAFGAIEGNDSDGDDFTNLQEINALTFPGNGSDFPLPANSPPVLGAIGNKTVNEGSLLSFTATATDPNAGQTLTFSLTGAPAGAAINPSTGAFTWTPTESQGPGSFPVTVRVTDNGSPAMSDTEAITVTVNEVNVAPVLAPIGNKSGAVGSPVTFTATATDSDIPEQTRTFSLGAGAPSGATINPSSGAFSWTPSTDGNFPVTVIVTDSGTPAMNDSEAITIAVTPPGNTAPVANPDSYNTDAGTVLNVGAPGVLGNDTDANSNPLTAVKVTDPSNGSVILNADGSFTYTPNANFNGSDSFTYKANDGTDDSNTATVTITVNGDTPPSTGVSVSPEDGSIDVPVTTIVSATNGSADISTVFNQDTFTLVENSFVALTNPDVRDDDSTQCVTGGIVNGGITYNTSFTVATFTPNCPLKGSTTYTATIAPETGVQQSVLAEPMIWSFTTIAMTPDSDDDGDPDEGDEFPDNCRNATPGTPKGKGKIKMELDGHPNGCFKNIKATSETVPSVNGTGMPSGYEFPDGIVTYEIVGISAGETDTVTLTYPEAFPAGSKVYKVDSGGFYEYSDAVIDGNTVTLKVTDGGEGDMDGMADGKILDPVGVAIPSDAGGGSIDLSTDAAGGGCSVAGTGGGWKEAAGSYGLLILAWLGLVLRRRKTRTGR